MSLLIWIKVQSLSKMLNVNHDYNVEQLRELGEDVERNVLARAVKWHLEDRIIVDGNKTVVF